MPSGFPGFSGFFQGPYWSSYALADCEANVQSLGWYEKNTTNSIKRYLVKLLTCVFFPYLTWRICDTNMLFCHFFFLTSCSRVRDQLYLLIVALQSSRFAPGAIQIIQLAEGTFSPNAETPNVATRSKSQQIQLVHIQKSNSYRKTDTPFWFVMKIKEHRTKKEIETDNGLTKLLHY